MQFNLNKCNRHPHLDFNPLNNSRVLLQLFGTHRGKEFIHVVFHNGVAFAEVSFLEQEMDNYQYNE